MRDCIIQIYILNMCDIAPARYDIITSTVYVDSVCLISPVERVDGDWGDWSKWSECTATCGEDIQSRWRQCDSPPPAGGGATCSGDEIDAEQCDTVECPGIYSGRGNW